MVKSINDRTVGGEMSKEQRKEPYSRAPARWGKAKCEDGEILWGWILGNLTQGRNELTTYPPDGKEHVVEEILEWGV